MSNKFAIYSGSTNKSIPTKFYWKNQNYKHLISYAKNIDEATKIFEKNIDDENWVQLVCLTTFNIIRSQTSININKPLFEGYYSSDDEYEKRQYIK